MVMFCEWIFDHIKSVDFSSFESSSTSELLASFTHFRKFQCASPSDLSIWFLKMNAKCVAIGVHQFAIAPMIIYNICQHCVLWNGMERQISRLKHCVATFSRNLQKFLKMKDIFSLLIPFLFNTNYHYILLIIQFLRSSVVFHQFSFVKAKWVVLRFLSCFFSVIFMLYVYFSNHFIAIDHSRSDGSATS